MAAVVMAGRRQPSSALVPFHSRFSIKSPFDLCLHREASSLLQNATNSLRTYVPLASMSGIGKLGCLGASDAYS